MIVLIPLTAFFLFGALFVLLELLRAPRGYEDSTGFHPVNATPVEKDARATSPASSGQEAAVSSGATSVAGRSSVPQ